MLGLEDATRSRYHVTDLSEVVPFMAVVRNAPCKVEVSSRVEEGEDETKENHLPEGFGVPMLSPISDLPP